MVKAGGGAGIENEIVGSGIESGGGDGIQNEVGGLVGAEVGGGEGQTEVDQAGILAEDPQPVEVPVEVEVQAPLQPVELIAVNFDFSQLGLTADFLEQHGIDRAFFNELPFDYQMEVIFQNMNQPAINPPAPSLPPAQPLLQTETQGNPLQEPILAPVDPNATLQMPTQAGPIISNANPMQPRTVAQNLPANLTMVEGGQSATNENVAFLESLPPNMREEILLQCPDSFLQSLPANI